MVKFIAKILYNFGLIGFGLYMGYLGAQHHQEVKRIEHNLLYNDRKPAPGFFQDPFGLEIEHKLNEEGMIESYLVHSPTEKYISVGEDMMPGSKSMLEAILKREVK